MEGLVVRFDPLLVEGSYRLIDTPHNDARGSFSRLWDAEPFRNMHLENENSYVALSRNAKRGIVRGMHMQLQPYAEAKTVWCVRGSAVDVVVDLRPESRSFLRAVSVEITETNGVGVYVPRGCAHGFQCTQDDTHVLYCISGTYAPEHSVVFRWNDPEIAIAWPEPELASLSMSDASAPSLQEVLSRVRGRTV